MFEDRKAPGAGKLDAFVDCLSLKWMSKAAFSFAFCAIPRPAAINGGKKAFIKFIGVMCFSREVVNFKQSFCPLFDDRT